MLLHLTFEKNVLLLFLLCHCEEPGDEAISFYDIELLRPAGAGLAMTHKDYCIDISRHLLAAASYPGFLLRRSCFSGEDRSLITDNYSLASRLPC